MSHKNKQSYIEHTSANENLEILYGRANWEPRREFDVPREIFDFQLKFAKEIAARTGEDVVEVAKNYTVYLHFFNLKDLKDPTKGYVEGLTEDNIVDFARNNYLRLRQQEAFTYRNEETGFGCFSYDYDPQTKSVTVHFKNAEFDPKNGPLSSQKLEQRQREFTDMLRHIKQQHPEAATMQGGSWLYNLESYCRLFPQSYMATKEHKNDEDQWHSTAIWGQFIDSNYKLKQNLVDGFLARVKEVPMIDLMSALPYRPLKAQGPIEDFYQMYKVA